MPTVEQYAANASADLLVWVTSHDGFRKQLTTEVAGLILHEGIDLHHIYGHIDFFDTVGIRTELPIIGREQIELTWVKKDTTILHEMYITAVQDVKDVKGVQVFRCYITTQAEVLNEVRPYSKSYQGTISEIVSEIYREKLGRDLDVIEASVGSFKYIVPEIKPFEAIDVLLPKGYDSNGSPLFLYQTVIDDYLKLESLDTIENKQPVATYYYTKSIKGTTSSSIFSLMTDPEKSNRIYSLERSKTFEFQKLLSNGVIVATQDKFDISTKTIEKSKFNYKTISKSSGEWYDSNYIVDGTPIDDEVGTSMIPIAANSLAFRGTQNNINTEEIDKPMLAAAKYNERNTIELRAVLNPHERLAAGDKIKLFIPSMNTDLTEDIEDPVYSGDYIISRLIHQVDLESYKVTAMLIKNKVG